MSQVVQYLRNHLYLRPNVPSCHASVNTFRLVVSLSLEAGTSDDYLFCLFRKFQKYIILLEGFSPLLILLLASQTEKPQEKYYNRSYVLLFCFSLIFKPASLSSFLNPQLVSTTTWTEVVALFFQT